MAEPTRTAAQDTAERVSACMYANDRVTQGLGIRVIATSPGHATLTMTVRADMLNGYDICHGGVIATLSDSAFAFACNSYNEMTVASGFAIELLSPASLGDVLEARCSEVSKAGRTGVYDTEVRNQRDERIAMFRGRSYTIKGKPVIPD